MTTFLHRAIYETIVALVTLSTFPLLVAIVAPLATIARLLTFIIREFRLMMHNRGLVVNYTHHQIISSGVSSASNISTTGGGDLNSSSAKERVLSQLAQKSSSTNTSSTSSLVNSVSTRTEFAQPNSNDCVVIVNAASSFEAEGLVRYYASRGCTVIACDKNQQQLSEIFKNEDQDLVKTISVTTPESASRVKDLVSQYVSSQFRPDPLALFAIIFVEPSGEVVMRRAMEREFYLGNNDFKKFFPMVGGGSNTANKKAGGATTTTQRSSYSGASSASSSTNYSSSELVFLLSEYLTRSSGGGGTVPDFLFLVKKYEEEQKKLLSSQTTSKSTTATKSSTSATKTNPATVTSPLSSTSQHHRRTSSLDATALLGSASAPSSTQSSSSKSAGGFSQTFTKSLSEQALENFVFNPMRVQTALARELVPLALRSMNAHHHHHHHFAKQTPFTTPSSTKTTSSSDFSEEANNKKQRRSSFVNHHGPNSSSSSSSSSPHQHQPRICVMTRKDEDETLSTALSLLNYSNSGSLSSLLSSSTTTSSENVTTSSSTTTGSSSSSLFSPQHATALKLLRTSVSTFSGIGNMRRMLYQSLLDVCEEIRTEYNNKHNDYQNKKKFVRWCHIELFSTSAQKACQKRWMQHLMEFYFSSPAHSRKLSTRNRWKVPRVVFSQNPYEGYFDEDETDITNSSSPSSPMKTDSRSSPPSASPDGSFKRRHLLSASSSSSPLRADRNQKSKAQIESEKQDLINCSYQISFLGDTINTPKPKRATYTCPVLSMNEQHRNPWKKDLNSLLHEMVSDIIEENNNQYDDYDFGEENNNEDFNEVVKFVPLSFWTRLISWSLREERMLDVMIAGFHSSTKVEQAIERIFEYVCS